MQKLPPKEKIPEAWTAIIDGRVAINENTAQVRSSNGAKTYYVRWEGDCYASTDSATYWQGYPGYPVLAVLMLQGRLPLNREVAARFGGINWTALNKRHKGDYSVALAEVYGNLQQAGTDTAPLQAEIEQVYLLLESLEITTKRGRKPPADQT